MDLRLGSVPIGSLTGWLLLTAASFGHVTCLVALMLMTLLMIMMMTFFHCYSDRLAVDSKVRRDIFFLFAQDELCDMFMEDESSASERECSPRRGEDGLDT